MAKVVADHPTLVSVVVPVYNVREYLEECLDSILSQTYESIEVIIVDDGSTDGSSKVVDRYALKDGRIIAVHKKNGGLSDARNAGIRVAKGDYVMFVDSDDYVDSRFVETALQNIREHGADVACFRFTYVDDESEIKRSSVSVEQSYSEYSNVESIKDIFSLGGTLKVNAWNKIYKRSLFSDNSIVYPVGRLYEDNLTTYKLLYFAKKIVYFNESLLFYRQRPGSIMKNKLTAQGIKDRLEMVHETTGWLHGKVEKRDLQEIEKVYMKTLAVVLAHESLAKKQPFMLPIILLELIKNKVKGL